MWKVLYENQIEALASTVTELRTVGNVKLDCRLKCFKVKLKILLVKDVCKYSFKLLKWKAVFAESVRSLRIFAYVIYRILIVWLKWYWCFTRTLDFYRACCAVGRRTRSTNCHNSERASESCTLSNKNISNGKSVFEAYIPPLCAISEKRPLETMSHSSFSSYSFDFLCKNGYSGIWVGGKSSLLPGEISRLRSSNSGQVGTRFFCFVWISCDYLHWKWLLKKRMYHVEGRSPDSCFKNSTFESR